MQNATRHRGLRTLQGIGPPVGPGGEPGWWAEESTEEAAIPSCSTRMAVPRGGLKTRGTRSRGHGAWGVLSLPAWILQGPSRPLLHKVAGQQRSALLPAFAPRGSPLSDAVVRSHLTVRQVCIPGEAGALSGQGPVFAVLGP